MRRFTAVLAVVLLAAPAAGAASAPPDDWPQFRGPHRDGHSGETGLFEQGVTLRERWRVPLGAGYSSVAVVDDRAVTMFGDAGAEYLAAFDTATGAERWRLRLGELYRDGQGDGPRATPTIHAGRVYGLGGQGVLVAASLADGRPLWRHDLREAYDAGGPTWGFSSSPLVVDDTLVAQVGGDATIVAFDLETGDERWRALDDTPGYAAPVDLTINGVRQLVFFTGERMVALPPGGGAPLWSLPWQTSYDVNAATPILIGNDRLLISSGYGVGGALVRIDDAGPEPRVEQVWHSRSLENQFSSSVVVDDAIYGFDNSILVCLDLATGEPLWRARDLGHGSLIYVDGHLIVLGERGTLAIVEVSPGEYREVAREQVFRGKTWTPPALSRHTLYVRDEHQLVALSLDAND